MSSESKITAASAKEILDILDQAEAHVQGILSSAADTVEGLSAIPLCSEKKLKDLSGKYLGHVRNVQEALKTHAYLLETETDIDKSRESLRLAETLLNLEQIEKSL